MTLRCTSTTWTFKRHLVLAADDQRIDDLARDDDRRTGERYAGTAPVRGRPATGPDRGVAREGAGDVERPLGIDRRGDGAGQDDGIVHRLDPDVVVRHHGLQDAGEFADVAPVDVDLEGGDLTTVLVQGEDGGRPLPHRHDVEAASRPDHGIGDLRLADEDFAGIGRKIDDDRFAHRHRESLRGGIGRDGQHGRSRRIGPVLHLRHQDGGLRPDRADRGRQDRQSAPQAGSDPSRAGGPADASVRAHRLPSWVTEP